MIRRALLLFAVMWLGIFARSVFAQGVDIAVVEVGHEAGLAVRLTAPRLMGMAPGRSGAFVADADTVALTQVPGTHRTTVTCKGADCVFIEQAFYRIESGGLTKVMDARDLSILFLGLRYNVRGPVPPSVRATLRQQIRASRSIETT